MEGFDEGRFSRRLLEAALSRSDTPCGKTDEDGRTQDLLGNGELPVLVENQLPTLSSITTDLRPHY